MCRKLIYPISFVLLLALTTTVAKADITTGLVGYWPLDGDATDASGNGLDGTPQGGATWVDTGQIGGAWQGDGSDDYIDLGTSSALDLSGAGQATIAAWVNMAVTKNHNSILTKGEWRDAYSLTIKGDTSPPNMLWTGNNTFVFSADTIPIGVWTHVAVTINGDLTNFTSMGHSTVRQTRTGARPLTTIRPITPR